MHIMLKAAPSGAEKFMVVESDPLPPLPYATTNNQRFGKEKVKLYIMLSNLEQFIAMTE